MSSRSAFYSLDASEFNTYIRPVTKQREKLGTKATDLDRLLLARYQIVALRLGYRSCRALLEDVLSANIEKLEAKAAKPARAKGKD